MLFRKQALESVFEVMGDNAEAYVKEKYTIGKDFAAIKKAVIKTA